MLETLHIKGESRTGNLKFLVQALASGAAPSLSRFYYDQPDFYTAEVEDLVGMVWRRERGVRTAKT